MTRGRTGARGGFWAVFVILALCVGGYFAYGYSQKEARADKARTAFKNLRNCENGKKAETMAADIKTLKPSKKMSNMDWFKKIGVADEGELSEFVQKAYWKEGLAAINELRALKANPLRAEELLVKITNAQAGAKLSYVEFGTSPIEVAQLVAMNKLKDAARFYGFFTVANLRAAGVIAPERVALKMHPLSLKKIGNIKPTKTSKVKIASNK